MSISYYGLAVEDEGAVGDIVEGRGTTQTIAAASVREALQKSGVRGEATGTLKWERRFRR